MSTASPYFHGRDQVARRWLANCSGIPCANQETAHQQSHERPSPILVTHAHQRLTVPETISGDTKARWDSYARGDSEFVATLYTGYTG